MSTREENVAEKQIVITGNPVDGFFFYGPFDSAEAAISWAEVEHQGQSWWVAPMGLPV